MITDKIQNIIITLLIILCFLPNLLAEKGEILATYEGGKVTSTELDKKISKIPPAYRSRYATTKGKQKLLDNICLEITFFKEAQRQNLDKDPEIKEHISWSLRPLYLRKYKEKEIEPKVNITKAKIKEYYNNNKDKFWVSPKIDIQHIEVENDSIAQIVRKELDNKMDYKELVKTYSINKYSKKRDGVIRNIKNTGYITGIGRDKALDSLIVKSEVAKFIGPVETKTGIHFFRITNYEGGFTQPLKEVREEIRSYLKPELVEEKKQEIIEDLRDQYEIEVDNDLFKGVNINNDSTYIDILDKIVCESNVPELTFTIKDIIDMTSKLTFQDKHVLTNETRKIPFLNKYLNDQIMIYDLKQKEYFPEIKNSEKAQQARKMIMIRAAYKELVMDKIEITDERIKEYQYQNKEKFSTKLYRKIRQFAFDNLKAAKKYRKEAKKALENDNSEKILTIVKSYSLSKDNNGIIEKVYNNNSIPTIGKDKKYVDAVWNTKIDHLSNIFKSIKDNYVFIHVLEEHPAELLPISEIRTRVTQTLKRQLAQEKLEEMKEKLYGKYNVVIFDKKLETILPADKLLDLAEQAQSRKQFKDAIQYYNQIIKHYKDSEKGYKAQFMKGFIYSEEINNPDKAIECFQTLLDDYQNGELHESARFMIESLKSGKEIDLKE